MGLWKWIFRARRYERDVKAVRRGRIGKRIWNRGVSRVGWSLLRKLYR